MSNKFLKNIIEKFKDEDLSIAEDGTSAAESGGYIDTGSYVLNALFSADIYGGISDNKATAFAGETSTGKTFFVMGIVKSFQQQNPDGVVIYYDSESAVTKKMMEGRGLDTSRILIGEPVTVQQWRHKAITFLDEYIATPVKDRPPVLMVLDSLGMLSTSKEIEDTAEGKETKDMTRAGIVRAAFRVLRLKLAKAKVSILVTNHTYAAIGSMYPTQEMCLSEDALVRTNAGVKKIGLIEVGDTVDTLCGPKNVDAINYYDAETFEMTMEDGTVIFATERHKFLVDGEWVSVGNIAKLVEEGKSINISAVTDAESYVYREQVLENLPTYDGES